MVESVLAQTYSKFELILVNADRSNSELSAEVNEALSRDRRIREVECPENRGISLNTAEGIKVAQGDYLAFLDHDDLLEPDTLFLYVSAINKDPSID
ncbi:glycosyltransferase, partial [Alistipes onderdonkii]